MISGEASSDEHSEDLSEESVQRYRSDESLSDEIVNEEQKEMQTMGTIFDDY
jgi:hypothetical protein